MNKTALITGASSGIGLALAHEFGRAKYDLIIAARGNDELQKAKAELERYGVDVLTIEIDLSTTDSAQTLFDKVKSLGKQIDVLCNNAGYAEYGLYKDVGLDKELGMVNLNVVTVTTLLKLYLQEMVARGSGKILNTGSTAGLVYGGPLMAGYYATKSYVVSLTQSLANELQGTGVTISALCPGPTKTKFQEKAGVKGIPLFSIGLMTPQQVASTAFNGLMRGKTIIIPGWRNKIEVFLMRISPRKLVTKIIRNLQER